MGERGGLPAVAGNGLGLECRVATGPGEARVPRNGPGGARLRLRPQPANRTRVLTVPDGGSAYARHRGSRPRPSPTHGSAWLGYWTAPTAASRGRLGGGSG